MLLFGTSLISLGSLLPAITERLDIDTLQAGSLAFLLPLGILSGSLIFGPIVDRYSYRNLFIISTLFLIIGFQGVIIGTRLGILQVAFLIIGFGGGLINGGANALVADISLNNPQTRGANLSLLGVFYGLGALTIPSLIGVLSSKLEYDQILKYLSVGLIFPVILFFFTVFPPPKQIQSIPLRQSFRLVKDKYLVILGFFLFFESALEGIISNWTTTYLQNQNQIDPADALLALSIYILSLTIGRLLLAAIIRRFMPYLILIISVMMMTAGVLVLFFFSSYLSAAGAMVLLGIGSAAGFPVILGYVGELYHELRGTAFSLVFFIGLVGNMLLNYFMGMIGQHFGMGKLPLVLLFVLGCMMILLGITRKKMIERQ